MYGVEKNMELNNSEIEKIQRKTCKIFDELVKSNVDDISEEERDSKYNELVQDVVYLVEEIVYERPGIRMNEKQIEIKRKIIELRKQMIKLQEELLDID